MTLLDYLLLGCTIFIALVLVDLTSSAIKWHIANYKVRSELQKKKLKMLNFRDDLKRKLFLSSAKDNKQPPQN